MPLRAASLCTESKARSHIITVLLCSVLFNLPRIFQFDIISTYNADTNRSMINVQESSIGYRSHFGIIYHNIFFTVILFFVPFIVLSVLNVKLILNLRGMDYYNVRIRRGRRKFNERNLTLVMIVIIISCLLCYLPERVIQLVKSFWTTSSSRNCDFMFYIQLVSNLLIITNSSTNFLVYYVFRQKFRQHLVLMCCTRCVPKEYIEKAVRDNSHMDRRISFRPLSNDVQFLSEDYHLTAKALNIHKQGFNAFILPILGQTVNKEIHKADNEHSYENNIQLMKYTPGS